MGSNPGGDGKSRYDIEREVVADVLRWSAGRTDIRIWRVTNGTFLTVDMNRPVHIGLAGAADITGIVSGGRRIEIECKSKTGKQRVEQIAFQRMIERLGGIYILARSVADVELALKEYLQ